MLFGKETLGNLTEFEIFPAQGFGTKKPKRGLLGQSGTHELRKLFALLMDGKINPIEDDEQFLNPEFFEAENLNGPFAPHYDQRIRPHVRTFDDKRIAMLAKLRDNGFIAIVWVACLIIFYFGFLFELKKLGQFTDFAALVMLFLPCLFVTVPISKLKDDIKREIFPEVFKYFQGDFSYCRFGRLTIEELKPSRIIPYYFHAVREDYIKGQYKNVSIEMIEANLTYREQWRKITAFNGLFILLSVNKHFSGQTLIKAKLGELGKLFVTSSSGFERVRLEDPHFGDMFEVYSSDQLEARYLLTTSFMERLSGLAQQIGETNIQASFYENKLLLMIPSNKDRFETSSIFQPATFIDDINGILSEMSMIFGIVETLKLNEKTRL